MAKACSAASKGEKKLCYCHRAIDCLIATAFYIARIPCDMKCMLLHVYVFVMQCKYFAHALYYSLSECLSYNMVAAVYTRFEPPPVFDFKNPDEESLSSIKVELCQPQSLPFVPDAEISISADAASY